MNPFPLFTNLIGLDESTLALVETCTGGKLLPQKREACVASIGGLLLEDSMSQEEITKQWRVGLGGDQETAEVVWQGYDGGVRPATRTIDTREIS